MSNIKYADICSGNVKQLKQWPADTPLCIVMLFERLLNQAVRRETSRLGDDRIVEELRSRGYTVLDKAD